MPTTVVIPVKSFETGKQRLATTLTPEARARLVAGLADHVATRAEEAGLIPLIVTADSAVAEWSIGRGIPSIPDRGQGLNDAAREGVRWALESRGEWLVLHGDLPLLTADDLQALQKVLADGGNPLSPSADGGTSAVGGRAAAPFYFGVGSFQRHLVSAPKPQIVFRTGLALDIDSPQDLRAALDHPRGRWLRTIL